MDLTTSKKMSKYFLVELYSGKVALSTFAKFAVRQTNF